MNEESKNAKIVVIKNASLLVMIWELITLVNIVHDTYRASILAHHYFHITTNIVGIFQPKQRFDYALMVGILKSKTFLNLMDWQAAIAHLHFQKTGQISVIVLDNASVHKSHSTTAAIERWQRLGLLLFFLPPYNPQMNRIEDEWLHLKRDELASRVFEDEVDLAHAIMAGIETRGQQGKYTVERFMFN